MSLRLSSNLETGVEPWSKRSSTETLQMKHMLSSTTYVQTRRWTTWVYLKKLTWAWRRSIRMTECAYGTIHCLHYRFRLNFRVISPEIFYYVKQPLRISHSSERFEVVPNWQTSGRSLVAPPVVKRVILFDSFSSNG